MEPATPIVVRREVVACLRKLGIQCGPGAPRDNRVSRTIPRTAHVIKFCVDPARYKEGAQEAAQAIVKELGSVNSQYRGTVALLRELPSKGIMLEFSRAF